MPSVVCLNLQQAQELIQRAGAFVPQSLDASGQGRKPALDSNWIVVAQDPAPGWPITAGSAYLGVLKYDEPNPC
jgi:hypothetical protein